LANGKAYVPLHGWEYAIVLLILSMFLNKYRDIYVSLSLAIIGHLLIDEFPVCTRTSLLWHDTA
jgi:hypothetical protein